MADDPILSAARKLAQHFSARPWDDMAHNRATLRHLVRHGHDRFRYDINEPTQEDCLDAARDVLVGFTKLRKE